MRKLGMRLIVGAARWLVERRIQRAMELMADFAHIPGAGALVVDFAAQPQFATAFLACDWDRPTGLAAIVLIWKLLCRSEVVVGPRRFSLAVVRTGRKRKVTSNLFFFLRS
jgi:hypothetical protein